MSDPLVVVGVPGSLRPGSRTRTAIETALHGAEDAGAETQLIDLGEYDLVFCDGQGDASRYHAGLLELRKQLTRARGIVLGTPEYHGSFSGVLKNALDLMGFPEFEGKIVGLVGVSEGPGGARAALDGLRDVGRALHGWVLPAEVSVPNAAAAIAADGRVTDAGVGRALVELGREVARFAAARAGASPETFLALWEQAPVNPGADNDVRPITQGGRPRH
jgi:NAD(P)H-dependent FMN reductase